MSPTPTTVSVTATMTTDVSERLLAYVRALHDDPAMSPEDCLLSVLDSALDNAEEMATDDEVNW